MKKDPRRYSRGTLPTAFPFLLLYGSAWEIAMATTAARVADDNTIHRVLRDNGLSLVLFGLFALSLAGQALAGHRHYNDEQTEHGQPTVSISEYLRSGAFMEATAENWESEFLQMGAYVLFTCFLFQRGSSEAKKIGEAA